MRGVGGERLQEGGELARPRAAPEPGVARSCPMTTTTSVPATPGTGTAVVSGCTCAGLTPMLLAMSSAAACCPAA